MAHPVRAGVRGIPPGYETENVGTRHSFIDTCAASAGFRLFTTEKKVVGQPCRDFDMPRGFIDRFDRADTGLSAESGWGQH